ncbi:MAG: SUMF1/EgtB/PvdO family nonheme iron enzyme, partial [Spirochaetales bacterium]|nr:SUMF1/EgtB/PvdO family nonheme iron enzyme [Spirochaetales bacterium]
VALSAAGVTITPSTISTSGDTATFTMPGNAVTVSAAFSSISAGYAQPHTVNGETFDIHYTPSGTFTMGENVETPTQTVTLTKNFWMGETEVTQGLWEAVWGTTWPGTAPSSANGDGDNKPAYYVNWYDAVAFCNKLTIADDSIGVNEQVYYSDATFTTPYTSGTTVYADLSKKGYRLPTEAEWEYAARYRDGTNWTRGDHVSGGPVYTDETDPDKVGDYAWYSGNYSPSGSKDVGQKTANSLGLKDMSGNVFEWCYDWYDAYSGGSETDPTGPESGSYRVYRGGVWNSTEINLRCAFRCGDTPTTRSDGIGFRLCRTAD